jgi:hypothetical protein
MSYPSTRTLGAFEGRSPNFFLRGIGVDEAVLIPRQSSPATAHSEQLQNTTRKEPLPDLTSSSAPLANELQHTVPPISKNRSLKNRRGARENGFDLVCLHYRDVRYVQLFQTFVWTQSIQVAQYSRSTLLYAAPTPSTLRSLS